MLGGSPRQAFAVNLDPVGHWQVGWPVLCRTGEPAVVWIPVKAWRLGVSLEVLESSTKTLKVTDSAVIDEHGHRLMPTQFDEIRSYLELARHHSVFRRDHFQCPLGYFNTTDGRFEGLPKTALYTFRPPAPPALNQASGDLEATYFRVAKYFWRIIDFN